MSRFEVFLSFLREYFRGSTGSAELRELFVCKGDPHTSRVKDRGVVWIHGLDTYLYTYIKGRLKEWNIYMGVGFLTEPGLTSPVLEKMLYDRLSYDFDSEEDPDTAVSIALSFAKIISEKYNAVPLVFESGFKGAHVVIPLLKPIDWEIYQLLWRKLYSEIPAESRRLVDTNMLQWNRVDRVPLTYNIKELGSRFCRIIYPQELSWEDFKWSELKPLDPERVKIVKIAVPKIVKPKIVTASAGKRSWIWKVVEKGLPDGRKRFLLYVLIPYLVNINNKSEDEILEICRTFLENSCKNHGNCDKVYESWIRSVIRSAKSHSFRGFGLSKLREKDQELYTLISEALSSKSIHEH
ncbi:MAG: DNA primase noncatalytic subunit PriX [Thermofilum sp.]|uniref:DNA primase noncatalytic subunit PriX n=1 Tax=Thermofilum sp. TaxID=1961369 RepID=UPI00316223E2